MEQRICIAILVGVGSLALLAFPDPGQAQQLTPQAIQSFSVGPDEAPTYPNGSTVPSHLVDLPDEHTTFIPLSGGSGYLVFAASKLSGGTGGAVALQTTDLKTFTFATALGYNRQVMTPPTAINQCNPTYQTEFDGNYAAPGSVVQDPTLPAGNLIMLYEAENHCPGGVVQQPFYATVGFARSSDNGKTWPASVNGVLGGPSRHPVLQSSDPQPSVAHGPMGDAIPSAYVDKSANGDSYLYVTYGYHAANPGIADGLIRVARAKLGTDPLTFLKWYNGSFGQPGITGLDTGVTPSAGCPNGRQAQSEINYNDDLGLYLLIFVCQSGPTGARVGAWYYSTATSLDLQNWTAPQMIQNSQFPLTTPCSADGLSGGQFDGWYPSFVSPGAASGHTKLTGQVFFMNGCDTGARQFMSRTFTITTVRPPGISSISVCSPTGASGPGSCPSGGFDTHQIVLATGGSSLNSSPLGFGAAPDEHSSIFAPGTLGSNQDYLFFLASAEGGHPGIGVGVLSGGSGPDSGGRWTLDFPRTDAYGSYAGSFGQVFNPSNRLDSCPAVADGNPAHQDQTFDMHYAAPGSIVMDPTAAPGALLMVYEGTNACIGNAGGSVLSNVDDYISLAIATSIDYGKSWPTYRGTPTFTFVPLPGVNQTQGPNAPMGALGNNVCMGNDCTTPPPASYGRYPVVTPPTSLASLMAAAQPLTAKYGEQEISGFVDDVNGHPAPYLYANSGNVRVARAQLNGGTAPLAFQKWNGQAFASPGLGGVETSVLPAGAFGNCEAPAQNQYGSSISYVDDTQQYLLTFLCVSPGDPALGPGTGTGQGAAWFYSTSYDLSDQTQWTPPREITGTWSQFDTSGGCPSYKGYYPSFMSLGKRAGHLSLTGYVFYLWGCQGGGTPPPGRQFSARAFTISNGCTYSLSLGGQAFPAQGGTGTIALTAAPGCPWTVGGLPSWVSLTSASSGIGNGTVTFQVLPNSGSDLSGSFTIEGQAFTVEQAAASVPGLVSVGSLGQVVSAGTWGFRLDAVNLGTAVSEARVNFTSDGGNPLPLPLTFPQTESGPLLASTLDRTISPNAQLLMDSAGAASAATVQGWGQLLTNGTVSGFGTFSNPTYGWNAVVPLETRNASSYVLAFDNTGLLATGVAIANLTAQAANVPVLLRDDTGKLIGNAAISLAAQGHTAFMLNPQYPATAGVRGTLEFDTPPGGQISVLGLRANGNALTTLPVLANVTTAGGSIGQVAYNGGFTDTFYLVNTGAAPASFTLSFFDEGGNPLPVPLLLPQSSSSTTTSTLTGNLAAGAVLVAQTQAQNGLAAVAGSAQLITTGSVSGFEVFNWTPYGQEASVPLETRLPHSFVLLFDDTNGVTTGVALANVANVAADITVNVSDDTGSPFQTATIHLAGRGHTSFLLPDQFPGTGNLRGMVELVTPAGGKISVIGLRAGPGGTLTTIPALTK